MKKESIQEGLEAYELKDYESAHECFEFEIMTNPNNPLPYLLIGLLYIEAGQNFIRKFEILSGKNFKNI